METILQLDTTDRNIFRKHFLIVIYINHLVKHFHGGHEEEKSKTFGFLQTLTLSS